MVRWKEGVVDWGKVLKEAEDGKAGASNAVLEGEGKGLTEVVGNCGWEVEEGKREASGEGEKGEVGALRGKERRKVKRMERQMCVK